VNFRLDQYKPSSVIEILQKDMGPAEVIANFFPFWFVFLPKIYPGPFTPPKWRILWPEASLYYFLRVERSKQGFELVTPYFPNKSYFFMTLYEIGFNVLLAGPLQKFGTTNNMTMMIPSMINAIFMGFHLIRKTG